jgi:hypothetical protein
MHADFDGLLTVLTCWAMISCRGDVADGDADPGSPTAS